MKMEGRIREETGIATIMKIIKDREDREPKDNTSKSNQGDKDTIKRNSRIKELRKFTS